MTGFTYSEQNDNSSKYCFQEEQSLNLSFMDCNNNDHADINANELELSVQHQIRQQHFSPSLDQRRDSLFQYSSSAAPGQLDSPQHQAELQPYAVMHATSQASDYGYPQYPMEMSRSLSQFSSTSNSNHGGENNRYLVPHGSFSIGSSAQAPGRSRSRSQFSSLSTARGAVHRSAATQPLLHASNHRYRRLSGPPSTTYAMNMAYSPTTTRDGIDEYNFDVDDIMGRMAVPVTDASRAEEQLTNSRM